MGQRATSFYYLRRKDLLFQHSGQLTRKWLKRLSRLLCLLLKVTMVVQNSWDHWRMLMQSHILAPFKQEGFKLQKGCFCWLMAVYLMRVRSLSTVDNKKMGIQSCSLVELEMVSALIFSVKWQKKLTENVWFSILLLLVECISNAEMLLFTQCSLTSSIAHSSSLVKEKTRLIPTKQPEI